MPTIASAWAGASRCLCVALLFSLCSGLVAAPAKSDQTETPGSWKNLRHMELEALRNDAIERNSPRHQIMLALLLVEVDFESAEAHLKNAQEMSPEGTDEARLADMLACSFSELSGTALPPGACSAYGTAIQYIEHPLPGALAQIHHGIWLAVNGRYSEAFQANRIAEELALAAGDSRLAATTQNNQGVDYLVRGLPVQALKKFQSAIERIRSFNDSSDASFLSTLTSNVASTHLELGDFESANALLQQLVNDENYDPKNPINLINEAILAKASLSLNRIESGYERLHAILQATGDNGVLSDRIFTHSVMGELEIARGDIDSGLSSFARAQSLAESSGDPLQSVKVNINFANSLVVLERYAQANELIETSIATLRPQGPSMLLAQALDLRSDTQRALGQRSAAIAASREARQIQLKVAGTEYDMDLIALGKSLELANKATELANAQKIAREAESQAQRSASLRNQTIVIALLVAFIAYLGLSRAFERKVAKTVQDANVELELKVSERTAALESEMAERLIAESARQSLAENLAENEKLQAIGQLTSGVAHDFNNLMTVVTLSADQLRNTPMIAESSSATDVDNIITAAESASDITASLLSYARKQPLAPQPTNLKNFILDSLPLFERGLGEGMHLKTQLHPCVILVDRSQLTTAIINLLLNAREASANKGAVTLQVKERFDPSRPDAPQHWADISVIDQGHGMAESERRRATEPFYTTKDTGQGTGLGLSMVDGFAKQSGGSLRIESRKHQGTSVSFSIPIYQDPEESEAPPAPAHIDVLPQGLVMIVDDQRPIREVMCRLLEKMNMETMSAANGADALEKLKHSAQPDLLITDLMMPGEISGKQLANQVATLYPDLPVLIMSGYTNSVELDLEFLHKPFSLDDLRAAITRTISHKQAA